MKLTPEMQRYAREILSHHKFTDNEFTEKFLEYQETKNPKIREELILNTLGLGVKVAANLQRQTEIEVFFDLVDECAIRIAKGLEIYDPDKSSFSTYMYLGLQFHCYKIYRRLVYAPVHIPETNKTKRHLPLQLPEFLGESDKDINFDLFDAILDTLNEKDKLLIDKLFRQDKNLQIQALESGVTRECMRQRKEKILKKLRKRMKKILI